MIVCTDMQVDRPCKACCRASQASIHIHTCCSSASTLTILRRPSLVSVLFSGRHLTTTLTHSALAGEPSIRSEITQATVVFRNNLLCISLAAPVCPILLEVVQSRTRRQGVPDMIQRCLVRITARRFHLPPDHTSVQVTSMSVAESIELDLLL